MKKIILLVVAVAIACGEKRQFQQKPGAQVYAEPISGDSVSAESLAKFFPVIDTIFKKYAKRNHFPSVAYGIVRGGQMIYSGSTGFSNLEQKTVSTGKSLYRIASMSKSFTAMSILKLRDEGKLQLSDPASKYIPEIAEAGLPTKDSAPITIQNLLTMSAGFPEDNPWGDRQLSDTDEDLLKLLKEGISFSNAPGIEFEYSNLGFALLGKIVTNVSGMPFQKYISENIMKHIGMNNSLYEYSQADQTILAKGYRWEDNQWKEEPMLHDGSYGAMGGLICSIEDFCKYVALHLSAWPPRDENENGPVKRSSIREMHQPWRFNNLFANAKRRTGEPCPVTSAYGYGLGWRQDCKGTTRISHGGGLPGFGSDWRIYPQYGLGIVSFSNRTYGGTAQANTKALDTLIELAGLKPRALLPSSILKERKEQLIKILPEWNDESKFGIFAENIFLDQTVEARRAQSKKLFEEAGRVVSVSQVRPENQLRGEFTIRCEKKEIKVFFTLTPESKALVQELDLWIEPGQ